MVVIVLADGFEEIEAVSPYDILTRGGVKTVFAGVFKKEAESRNGVKIVCHSLLSEVDLSKVTMLVLPGGMPGVENLEKSEELKADIGILLQAGKKIGAICAAPSILGKMGLLNGKKACSYTDFEKDLHGAEITRDKVAIDLPFITSRGAGTASDFGFALLSVLKGEKLSDKIRKMMFF